jgi:hypothetical protein
MSRIWNSRTLGWVVTAQTALYGPSLETADNAPGATHRGRSEFLERETGLEPATLSLGREDELEEDR